MTLQFEILRWDSNFFDFPVGKITEEIRLESQLEKLHNTTNLNLIYYYSNVELNDTIINNRFYQTTLVDAKVEIQKELNKNAVIHPKVEIYKEDNVDPDLMKLALTAGVHSRFFKDSNISHSKSKELYEIWIEKSVQRKLADIVMVYREEGKIIGFITLLTKDDDAFVSLLAVDPLFEGRGVSFALMNSTEAILSSRGYSVVKSQTQDHNKRAMLIYKRQGMQFGEKQYVYHLWRNTRSNS